MLVTLGGVSRQHPGVPRGPWGPLLLPCWRIRLGVAVGVSVAMFSISSAFSQISVVTQHYDNARTGQNTSETILNHANVNVKQFGKLFTQLLDGQEAGQPLYVPNVFIPAVNATHNVVYAATQHDSVYAFDADNNQGNNALPLWRVNFLNPANGISTVPQADELCQTTGYTEFGIQGTPVIDLSRNAIYVLAMTKENGTYVHKLHALDLGTGAELFNGPVTVAASVTINNHTYTFVDKYQQQRPGLLLQNGIVYIGFGSPGCNIKTEMGWVMAYDAGTLQQVGVFNVSPGVEASAVWMSGAGLAGDGAGNVYFTTGDGLFDADTGGSHFGNSVLKLNQGSGVLNLADYFTPYNQQFLETQNLDLGAGQVTLLPEQPTAPGKLAVTVGKAGVMYLLDEDNLGKFSSVDNSQIVQEVAAPVNGHVHAGLTYWNNTIFLEAERSPVMAYSFTNGRLSSQPISQTTNTTFLPRGGIVSSNGANDGIFWCVTPFTNKLFAFDATNLSRQLYDNSKAGSRDSLSSMVHFGMPIVANGKVYINGKTQLAVFGLLPFFATVGGNNQTGAAGATLAIPLQVGLEDPYTGNSAPVPGVPVTFSDGGKGGVFSNPHATTDSSGGASTMYTLPSKAGAYTITASSPNRASVTFVVTATAGVATTLSVSSGNFQAASVGSTLPLLPDPSCVPLRGCFAWPAERCEDRCVAHEGLGCVSPAELVRSP